VGRAEGLTERAVLDLSHHRESGEFTELEKLALDYALALSETPVVVTDELFEALRAQLDEAQLMELTATAAWENYLARFNRGFAVESQGFSDGAVCPLPDHRVAKVG
jgi:alkylhydroperoxidase family enzyme